MNRFVKGLAVMIGAVGIAGAAAAQDDFAGAFGLLLSQAHTAEARALAESRIASNPADSEARFALGAAEFLGAVEHLGQGLYRLGLRGEPSEWGLMKDLMFLRVPVPPNPAPEPMTPEALRAVLIGLSTDLATAEADLARVPEGPVALPLDVGAIRLDLTGNGKADEATRLIDVLAAVSGVDARIGQLAVTFDESDVPWLRGYAHLLMAVSDVLIGYDWSESVEATFQALFPGSSLPSSPLNAQDEKWVEIIKRLAPDGNCYSLDPWSGDNSHDDNEVTDLSRAYSDCLRAGEALWAGGIADIVAFIHLWHWPLLDAERVRGARQHLLQMIALSRQSWALIAAETDDDHEWIPGVHQHGPFANMQVNEDVIAQWIAFIDGFEKVLNGELLLPHWRFVRTGGLDMRKLFDQPPQTLDPLLLIQGSAAIPYIADGKVAAATTVDNSLQLLSEGFVGYFLWFN